jgi:hypothetical protein
MQPTSKPSRLQPVEEFKIDPFVQAPESKDCELYWVPVFSFPPPAPQREWLIDFFQRLDQALAKEHGVRGEFFLQQTTVPDVEKRFLKTARELLPKLGLARKPNAPLPPPPTINQLKAGVAGQPFDIEAHFPDYCYWLHHPELSKLLGDFFGHGGSATFYLKPDPATKPPEIPYMDEFKKLFPQMGWDTMDTMVRAGFAAKDKFLEASKKLFGEGLEEEPSYEGLPYILPLLTTTDFFQQPEAERKKWFELFDVFWRESPVDKGIYVASKVPLAGLLHKIIESMKEAGKLYP